MLPSVDGAMSTPVVTAITKVEELTLENALQDAITELRKFSPESAGSSIEFCFQDK